MRELNDWIYDCKLKNMSEKTIKHYNNHIKLFLRTMEIQSVEDISRFKVQDYINSKIESNAKPSYINGCIRVLRAFCLYLIEEEYINKNPMEKVKWAKQPNDVIETFTDSDARKLFDCYSADDFLSIRNKTVLSLFLDSGIRCTELIKITSDDIKSDRILINGKGNKQRFVPLSAPMYKQIKRYLKAYDNYFEEKQIHDNNIFLSRTGRKLTVEGVERVFKTAQESMYIDKNIRCSPHTARHYFAITMLQTNDIFTVSKLLGHSNIQITQVYLKSLNTSKLIDRYSINTPLMSMKNKIEY